jgi:hypothetical protein
MCPTDTERPELRSSSHGRAADLAASARYAHNLRVAHSSSIDQHPAGARRQRYAIALIITGFLAAVGSCLTWRTVTTIVAGKSHTVLERDKGLHFTKVGTASIGVGDLTLLIGVLAIVVGGVLLLHSSITLLVGALTTAAGIVLLVTLIEAGSSLRADTKPPFGQHAGVGLWLTFVGVIALLIAGGAYLIDARREGAH